MASNFDKYAYTKNGVVETSALLATTYGRHILNLVCESDLENGCVAKVGAYKEAEVYKAEAPAITDEIVLIANQVKIYEEYNTKMQEESQYYIKKGEIAHGDDLDRHDRFALSKESFGADANPEVGEYVGVEAGKFKLTTLGKSAPAKGTRGFVAIIEDVAKNGNFRIHVLRNMAV